MNIKEQIENKFNLCISNNCIEVYTADFDIEDDRTPKVTGDMPTPCYKVNFGLGEFSVETNGNAACFLKIDACILFEKDGKKCDCAVFTDKEFVFVELKQIEKGSKNDIEKRGSLRRKSYRQIADTLNIFLNDKNIDFSLYQNSGKFYVLCAVFDANTRVKYPAASIADKTIEQSFQKNYMAIIKEGNGFSFK